MRGTQIADYLKAKAEANAKMVSIAKKNEEDEIMEEINQEEHSHDFDRLAVEM